MMRALFTIPLAATALLAVSCGPEPGPPAAADSEPSAEQISSRLEKIVGTAPPEDATNLTVSTASLSAEVADFGFICSRASLDAFIDASPSLAAARNQTKPAPGRPLLITHWERSDPTGTQFVSVELSSLGEETVAVEIGTVFLRGLQLDKTD